MSNTINKLQKVRTFAQDAKTVEQGSKGTPNSAATESGKKSSRVTGETQINETPSVPIPKKQPPAITEDRAPDPEIRSSTTTFQKGSDNPPFHQLQTLKHDSIKANHTDKKKAVLDETAKQITDGPESILSQEAVKQVDVNELGDATILSDTKRKRKTIMQAISESTSAWFQDFKNTYITPPKPSYTVTKSERRAGVVTDATARTGATNVSHDDFAARLRARFTATEEEGYSHTDPVFPPELPPKRPTDGEGGFVDVEIVPRNSSTAHTNFHQDFTDESATHQFNTADPDMMEEGAEKHKTPDTVIPEPDQLKNIQLDHSYHKERSVSQMETQNSTPTIPKEQARKQTVSSNPRPSINSSSPTKDTTSVPSESEHLSSTNKDLTSDIQPVWRSAIEGQKSTNNQVSPSSSRGGVNYARIPIPPPYQPITSKAPTDQTEVDEQSPTEKGEFVEVSDYSEEPITSRDTKPSSSSTPTNPIPNPTSEDTDMSSEDTEVLIDEQEMKPEERETSFVSDDISEEPHGDPNTNLLSLKIVLGIMVVLLLGYILFFSTPQWTDNNMFYGTPSTIPESVNQILLLDQYPNARARLLAINELVEGSTTERDLLQIALMVQHNTEWYEALPRLALSDLGLRPPHSFQVVVTNIYVGGFKNTHPFIFLKVSDQQTAQQGMLEWEGQMETELLPLFGPVSGDFTDEMYDDYDLRVLSDDNSPVITYGFDEHHIVITTTPETWVEIIQHLR